MSGRGGGGRGAYYKAKYGRGRGSEGSHYAGQTRKAEVLEDDRHVRMSGSHPTMGVRGTASDLAAQLQRIDGKGYGAYHDIAGGWSFPKFTLWVDRIQGDPYASPSKCRVVVGASVAGLPRSLVEPEPRRTACADFLARRFAEAVAASGGDVRHQSGGWRGEKGGEMGVDCPGQYVLPRTACTVRPDGSIEARFTVAMPAQGRTVLGSWAATILCSNLPRYVSAALKYASLDAQSLRRHTDCVEDSRAARAALSTLGLVAWVADGSVLPRASGASEAPLAGKGVVPTKAPPGRCGIELDLPHAGKTRGLGIPKGVTLIVGGGFHGKSTLLQALERGVYDKIPGDGRELVVTDFNACKIRAEDGRRVDAVDIEAFISDLPGGQKTSSFSTQDASGSTSQAAAIQEAIEAGASTLLIDEDTSATNFMVRDARMQALVAPDREPITPFVKRVKSLATKGFSTVLVVGGTGDYFGEADLVLGMDAYRISDLTQQAHDIAAAFARQEGKAAGSEKNSNSRDNRMQWSSPAPRTPMLGSLKPQDVLKMKTRDKGCILVADTELNLCAVEQIVELSQTRAIAATLQWLVRRSVELQSMPLQEILDRLDAAMDAQGLDAVTQEAAGNLARPRRLEIAAAINRWRLLPMRQLR